MDTLFSMENKIILEQELSFALVLSYSIYNMLWTIKDVWQFPLQEYAASLREFK